MKKEVMKLAILKDSAFCVEAEDGSTHVFRKGDHIHMKLSNGEEIEGVMESAMGNSAVAISISDGVVRSVSTFFITEVGFMEDEE